MPSSSRQPWSCTPGCAGAGAARRRCASAAGPGRPPQPRSPPPPALRGPRPPRRRRRRCMGCMRVSLLQSSLHAPPTQTGPRRPRACWRAAPRRARSAARPWRPPARAPRRPAAPPPARSRAALGGAGAAAPGAGAAAAEQVMLSAAVTPRGSGHVNALPMANTAGCHASGASRPRAGNRASGTRPLKLQKLMSITAGALSTARPSPDAAATPCSWSAAGTLMARGQRMHVATAHAHAPSQSALRAYG
jgi:hypothetical protein